jgi:predicted kinase
MSAAGHPATEDVAVPTLVLMAGMPGAGKTTLALALGRALGWPVIDKDTLKTTLLDVGVTEEIAGRASYELLLELGRDLLVSQRLSVVLDSPAAYPVVIERAVALARQANAHLKILLCLAERDIRNQRVATRTSRRSQPVGISTTDGDGRSRFDFLPADALPVDTTRPLPDLIREIAAHLLGR